MGHSFAGSVAPGRINQSLATPFIALASSPALLQRADASCLFSLWVSQCLRPNALLAPVRGVATVNGAPHTAQADSQNDSSVSVPSLRVYGSKVSHLNTRPSWVCASVIIAPENDFSVIAAPGKSPRFLPHPPIEGVGISGKFAESPNSAFREFRESQTSHIHP